MVMSFFYVIDEYAIHTQYELSIIKLIFEWRSSAVFFRTTFFAVKKDMTIYSRFNFSSIGVVDSITVIV